ncbi:MAG TPA: hypothetical protein VFO60_10000 [Candidatus Dormibacteraeota bacterium]|nr:hypothetical protein [Candidatus Dormibacteraeota bacterium]
MRRALRILPLSVAAAAGIVSCGSSGSSSSSTGDGAPAKQATVASLQRAGATSVRSTISGSFGVDTSRLQNVPPDILRTITGVVGGGGTVSFSGTGEQESASRVRLTLTIQPMLSKPLTAVLYDGTLYYSLDGGRTFGSGGSLSSITGGLSVTPSSAQKLFGALPEGAFTDDGQTQVGGVTVEHYSAQITKDNLFSAIAGAAGSGSQAQQNLQQLAGFITSTSSSVDAYVRPDGSLQRYSVDVGFGFDVGALVQGVTGGGGSASGGGGPGGVLQVHSGLTADFSDVGAAITVPKPVVSPNAPKLPAGLTGLSGLI